MHTSQLKWKIWFEMSVFLSWHSVGKNFYSANISRITMQSCNYFNKLTFHYKTTTQNHVVSLRHLWNDWRFPLVFFIAWYIFFGKPKNIPTKSKKYHIYNEKNSAMDVFGGHLILVINNRERVIKRNSMLVLYNSLYFKIFNIKIFFYLIFRLHCFHLQKRSDWVINTERGGYGRGVDTTR